MAKLRYAKKPKLQGEGLHGLPKTMQYKDILDVIHKNDVTEDENHHTPNHASFFSCSRSDPFIALEAVHKQSWPIWRTTRKSEPSLGFVVCEIVRVCAWGG